jgi:hypothetical protein
MPVDYERLYANNTNSVIGLWIGPSGGTTLGITDIAQPAAAELNNTGGTSGIQVAAQSVSWNDWSFGLEGSETNNEPSLADSASYEEFGESNYGGEISFYAPPAYDDPSNPNSVIYDLTDTPGEVNDIAIRIDGDTPGTAPAANGDYVSDFRAEFGGEANPFTPGESKRRTVSYNGKGDFAHYTVVGPHTIVAIPPAVDPWDAGRKARLRASVQGREYTNALEFSTSDPAVVDIDRKGGAYEVTGTAGDSAIITITDPEAGTSATVNVTVTAP